MATYVVKHDMIGPGDARGSGGVRKGAAVTRKDFADGEWDRLVETGAVGKATDEEQAALDALQAPEEKAIEAGQDKPVPADSAALTSGQPGGAPVGESAPADDRAQNTASKDVKK